MKKYIITIIFCILTYVIHAQDSVVDFEIHDISITENSMVIDLSIKNNGDTAIVFYKPSTESMCYGFLVINILNSEEEIFEINPCDEIIDLDEIILNFCNAICLSKDEIFRKIITIDKNSINLPKVKDDYIITIWLMYSEINFSYKYPGLKYKIFKDELNAEKSLNYPN